MIAYMCRTGRKYPRRNKGRPFAFEKIEAPGRA